MHLTYTVLSEILYSKNVNMLKNGLLIQPKLVTLKIVSYVRMFFVK